MGQRVWQLWRLKSRAGLTAICEIEHDEATGAAVLTMAWNEMTVVREPFDTVEHAAERADELFLGLIESGWERI